MRKYYVRVGPMHALVETDEGVIGALLLFSEKVGSINQPADVHVQEIYKHIRKQVTPAVTRVTRKEST